jgi:hypothetical protein
VSNRRLIRKLEHLDAVRRDLAALLVRLGLAIRKGIAGLRRGMPASAQARDAAAMHVEVVQKLDDMHSAVHQARAEGVRVLVEDEGMPISSVARLMGRPRQLVARLYQQALNGRGASHGNGGRSARRRAARGSVGDRTSGAAPRTRIPPAAR